MAFETFELFEAFAPFDGPGAARRARAAGPARALDAARAVRFFVILVAGRKAAPVSLGKTSDLARANAVAPIPMS
jgi:hypothetical protein